MITLLVALSGCWGHATSAAAPSFLAGCPPEGAGGSGKNADRNRMKNRTDPGTTVEDVSFADLAGLSEPVGVERGTGALAFAPETRFVRVVGYAASFGRADGEPCNCNKGAKAADEAARFVDMHVRLVATPADIPRAATDPAVALVTEATPRLMSTTCRDLLLGGPTPETVDGPSALTRLGIAGATGQVRLTGWLFADDDKGEDSAHGREDAAGKRLSVWEVHPLLSIEACTTPTPCDPAATTGWASIWSARTPADPGATDNCGRP